MTAPAPEASVLKVLDFVPLCDASTDGCENTAKWTFTARCCRNAGTCCDFHHMAMLKRLFAAELRRARLWCPACGKPVTGVDGFTFTPIRGGAR